MLKGLTIQQSEERFPTNDSCMQYLVEQKWHKDRNAAGVDIENLVKESSGFISDARNAVTTNQPLLMPFFIV